MYWHFQIDVHTKMDNKQNKIEYPHEMKYPLFVSHFGAWLHLEDTKNGMKSNDQSLPSAQRYDIRVDRTLLHAFVVYDTYRPKNLLKVFDIYTEFMWNKFKALKLLGKNRSRSQIHKGAV